MGVFGWPKVIFVKWCEEENGKENVATFRNTYLVNYWADFLQIWPVGSRICLGHKICEFDRNQSSGYRGMRG